MKPIWLTLLFLGTALASVAAGVAVAPLTPGHRITDAIYFRDASGRCLRLQPDLADDGKLMVLIMSNAACVKREQTR
jgi:hypothetical protein